MADANTVLAAEELRPALMAYLTDQLGMASTRFETPPEQITHGWETYIYTFQLAGDGLAPDWSRPLILRVYPGTDQDGRAEREAGVQRFVAQHGYPAPRPLAFETSDGYLGRPFMIMERVRGVPMLDLMAGNPVGAYRSARSMAALHVALHRLPVDGCPLPTDGALVDRRIDDLHSMLAELGASVPEAAQPALAWLIDQKEVVAQEQQAVCHTDFHPLNILVDDDTGPTVIDWSATAIGDRHSDVASTLVMLRTAPNQAERLVERLAARFGRRLFAWFYLRCYRQVLSVDPQRLAYWEALRAFEWWIFIDIMRKFGSTALGWKSDITERLPPGQGDRMIRYFWQRAW